eukprot:TRINITY_DN60540_c0_g2_i1.p1 TRINITY_DN60540_c0_g2~~TRINITY_DN60540_c0_g2_i1.p1  ORF type:complete len:312 (+),score=19.10 TRINITY_DN60540_c0_g2_i1:84-1019(+)
MAVTLPTTAEHQPWLPTLLKTSGNLTRVISDLSTRGFSFVPLPTFLKNQTAVVVQTASKFFDKPMAEKEPHFTVPVFGYISIDNREGLRLLTGQFLKYPMCPPECEDAVRQLGRSLDAEMIALSHVIFGQYLPKAATTEPPLLFPLLSGDKPKFGLLDIAHYYNETKPLSKPGGNHTGNGLNCAEHTDPGLLSLNVCDSTKGLEFWDPSTASWVQSPCDPNIGLLWCGDAASVLTNGVFTAGKHRVVTGCEPRLSIWHEICIMQQVPTTKGGIIALEPELFPLYDSREREWSLAYENSLLFPQTKAQFPGK